MPKSKKNKKPKQRKNKLSNNNNTSINKKSKKSKKSKNDCTEKWWIMISIMMACISILLFLTFNQSSFSGIAMLIGQPKSPAKQPQIEQLTKAISTLNSIEVNSLLSEYEFNLSEDNTLTKFPNIGHTMNAYFANWAEQIHDNDQFNRRMHILNILMDSTNIHDQYPLCLCILAAQYRLIDALKLVLSEMSQSSIVSCFMFKQSQTNNTILHIVSESKSASFARWILKMGYDNPKLSQSFARLYVDIDGLRGHSSHWNNNNIVSQKDIKQWTSQIDIELVIEYALKTDLKKSQNINRFFFAQNVWNYTAFDYWRMSHSSMKMVTFLKKTRFTKENIFEKLSQKAKVEQSVNVEHCNTNEQVLFDNTCSPPIIYDWKDFDFYWKTQRPVIIRSGYNTNDGSVDLKSLVENYGDLQLMVAEIPYAPLFGIRAWSIPMKEYVNVILNNALHESNLYAFDKEMISSNHDLQNFFNFSIPFMDSMELNRTYQLALGPANSGSPPHWHKPAFNRLYLGRKMWWMFSPKNSIYSSINVVKWINQEYKKKVINGEAHRHYCFIQEKGDIVFVPNAWSHAVSNLQTSLAVAIEFDV